jgi:hypothetical protein
MKDIDTPHVHDPSCPGGIRSPEAWETPYSKNKENTFRGRIGYE